MAARRSCTREILGTQACFCNETRFARICGFPHGFRLRSCVTPDWPDAIAQRAASLRTLHKNIMEVDANASDGVDFELGCTEDVQGSCRWREGRTEVVATVDGPAHRADRAASQDPSRGGLEVRAQLAARSSVQDRNAAEKAVEDALQASLGAAFDALQCPRRVTTVFCLVIADDPEAARRCALNAASLALLDARAPMRAIPLAVAVACGGCTVDAVLDAARDDAAVLALESRGAPVKAGDLFEAVHRASVDVKALRARVLAGGRE